MKTSARQNGISLIEILVVMVLLLIGILSVIRVFPPGFLINKQTEANTAANRMADNEVQRYVAGASSLPDGIVPVHTVSGYLVVSRDVTPNDLSSDGSTNALDRYQNSDANKFRRVIGERMPLPAPVATTGLVGNPGTCSVAMLLNGPVLDRSWNSGQASLNIHGAALGRVVADSTATDPPAINGPGQYAIDYNAGKIAFYPDTKFDRKFYITLTAKFGNSGEQTVLDLSVAVPMATQTDPAVAPLPQWQALPLTGATVVQNSEVVSRAFLPAPQGTNGTIAWTAGNAYEFSVVCQRFPTYTSGDATTAIGAHAGAIAISPNAYGTTEETANGTQKLTPVADYDVYDWHVIREDRPMPAPGVDLLSGNSVGTPYRVQLGLKGIKQVASTANNNQGDYENDQTAYQGLFYGLSMGAQPDLLIYNVGTGEQVPASDYKVDYEQGFVTFSDTYGAAHQSATFRFFYKVRGDWAMRVDKAYAAFKARGDYDLGYNEGRCEYFAPTNGTRIYFPLTEAGKTVSIGDLWYRDSSGNPQHVTNESYRISDSSRDFQTVTVNGATRVVTSVDISGQHSDAASLDDTQSGAPLAGVTGVSLRVRMVWNNGAAVATNGNTNNFDVRWHKMDVDTALTRKAL